MGEGERKTSKGKKGRRKSMGKESRGENERWYLESAPMHPAMRHRPDPIEMPVSVSKSKDLD